MIVVDANIMAFLFLPGAFTAQIEALLEEDGVWAAPLLWRSEFRNVLAGYMRRGALDFQRTKALQREAESLRVSSEFAVDSDEVLELAANSDCSAHDCEFDALALALDVKLVTIDAKLRRAFLDTFRSLV